MTKQLSLLAIMLLALGSVSLTALPVLAGEEGEGAPKAEKPPKEHKDAKGEGEGGEGGEGGGAPKSKGPTDVTGGRFAGDPVYVHLAPMVMPVISANGVEQLVTMQIDIEVKDFDVADTVHTKMPRVVDALMTALYGGLGQGLLRNGKLVDVHKVKARATAALNDVIGAGNIREVLVQGVSQRML